MKRLLLILLLIPSARLAAVSLDGTAGVIFETTSYSFADGDEAKGFVRLDAGFSVPAAGTVTFNVLTPVVGVCDLNNTGKVVLDGDLHLASNATLPNGCIFDGQGYVVFLDGNMSLPASKLIEFAGDTIIDGQNHELVLENGNPGGGLFINGPSDTVVTLRNMTIRGVRGFDDGTQAIGFGSNPNQTLILENVKLQLAEDFFFLGGKLEIKNRVEINGFYKPGARPELGSMLFYYQSSDDLLIHRDSTLFLDLTVGFFYQPLDSSKKHFVFDHYSSRLFLNGSSFFVPGDIGLRLTKGHIVVDGRTFLQSDGVADGTLPIEFGSDKKNKFKDVIIDILPGAKLEVTDAFVLYQNQK